MAKGENTSFVYLAGRLFKQLTLKFWSSLPIKLQKIALV